MHDWPCDTTAMKFLLATGSLSLLGEGMPRCETKSAPPPPLQFVTIDPQFVTVQPRIFFHASDLAASEPNTPESQERPPIDHRPISETINGPIGHCGMPNKYPICGGEWAPEDWAGPGFQWLPYFCVKKSRFPTSCASNEQSFDFSTNFGGCQLLWHHSGWLVVIVCQPSSSRLQVLVLSV